MSSLSSWSRTVTLYNAVSLCSNQLIAWLVLGEITMFFNSLIKLN
jgi:hypothetical protein